MMTRLSLAVCCCALLLLAAPLALAGDDDEARPDFGRMKVKELKTILADRGQECKGCAEKGDYVKLAEESWDLPIVKAAPPPEAEEKFKPDKDGKTPEMSNSELNDMIKKMQMENPGLNMKMFSGDDLKDLSPEDMAKKFGGGGGGGGGKRPKGGSKKPKSDEYKGYGSDEL